MNIGLWEVILLLLVVAIIFGAGKLPNVMGDLAKGIRNFRTGLREPDKTESGQTVPEGVTAPTVSPSPGPSDDHKPPTI